VVRRDPFGRVLILGTWNYPLLLMGTQAAQALAAGNRVLLKPAAGCEAVTEELIGCFHRAGVPPDHLVALNSTTEAATEAIESGVDLIVLTGSAATGRKVMAKAAETLTPTIMELSGCDAVVVMPSADFDRTAQAIRFALTFNSGATCIGPRRLIVEQDQAGRLIEALGQRLMATPPMAVHPAARESVARALGEAIDRGARDCLHHLDLDLLRGEGRLRPILLDNVDPHDPIAQADLFAPVTSVIRVTDIERAVDVVNECRYRLAASVFGDRRRAVDLGGKLDVGSITINDLVVPTADPRLPFGGRGDSGFGVTRGDEGLLAMSVPTVISQRRGRFMPHLDLADRNDADTLLAALQLLHAGSLRSRLQGLRRMVRPVKTADG
jgi:aldehyde dehydrogenase (NAD+)